MIFTNRRFSLLLPLDKYCEYAYESKWLILHPYLLFTTVRVFSWKDFRSEYDKNSFLHNLAYLLTLFNWALQTLSVLSLPQHASPSGPIANHLQSRTFRCRRSRRTPSLPSFSKSLNLNSIINLLFTFFNLKSYYKKSGCD